ncbi:MAG TPA: MazG-like family protein [Streptosporangiaceae bacterium]|nr:MazG-like family protein [Streptosporangiaceae bacterium]
MWDYVRRLHEFHGDVPVEICILKLSEEVGEAAEALIGMRGLTRKGHWRTRDDLLDELSDVIIIITAAVAMSAVTDGQVDEARDHFQRRLETVVARADSNPAAQVLRL